ncbi:kinase-like domain-containing protein, partial [Mycena olivaceomarginata]
NILVTSSHRACIADFGLSSIMTSVSSVQVSNSTQRTQGTIRYQGPELHRGEHNDRCSDIYAFACVAYEMFTGRAPFAELRPDSAVITAVLFDGRRPSQPPLCTGTPSLDNLWHLIQDCWAADPTKRPTVAELVQRLTQLGIRPSGNSTSDWDDTCMSKFRRHVLGQRSPPSIPEFEHLILNNGWYPPNNFAKAS